MNLSRLRQIAEYQHETGTRVEYPAETILALLNEIERGQQRLEFCIRNFMNSAVWDSEAIDEAMRARCEKGFD